MAGKYYHVSVMISAFCSGNEWKLQQKCDWERQLLFHFHHLPACFSSSTWGPTEKTLAGKGNQRKVCCKHPCSQNQFMFNNSICTIFSCPEGWGVRRGWRKRKQAKKFTYLYPWGKKLNFVGTSEWIAKIHWWRKKEEVGEIAWVLEMGCFRKRRKTEMEVKLEELCFMKGVSWDRDIAGNYSCLCNPVV